MNTMITTARKPARTNPAAAVAAALRPSRSSFLPAARRPGGAFWDADQPFYVHLPRPADRALSPVRFLPPRPGQIFPP